MNTSIIKEITNGAYSNTTTALDFYEKDFSERPSFVLPPASNKQAFSKLWSNLGNWVLIATVATAITPTTLYTDSRHELRKSGASSVYWSNQRKKGTPISLSQARELAIKILSDTDQRLKQERNAESRFVINLWEDNDELRL